jgi:hypothetical protein
VSGALEDNPDRFVFGARYIPDHSLDRAKLRTTLAFRFTPRLSLGIEYNPLASDVSPLANWLAVSETRTRPALMFGVSSDRIGTPSGQSYYFTISKNLERWIKLPIAPYVGAAYGTYENEVRPAAGGNIRLTKQLSALIIYDGEHTHPTLSWTQGRHVFTAMMVQESSSKFYAGMAYSVSFDLPSRSHRSPQADAPHDLETAPPQSQ